MAYESLFQKVAVKQGGRKLADKGFVINSDGIVETINAIVIGTRELEKNIQQFHASQIRNFYNTGNKLIAERRKVQYGYRPEDRASGLYRFGKGTIFEGTTFKFTDGNDGIAGMSLVDEQRADQLTRSEGGAPVWRAIEEGVPAGRHRLPEKFGFAGEELLPIKGPANRPGGGTTGLWAVEDAGQIVLDNLDSGYRRIALSSYRQL